MRKIYANGVEEGQVNIPGLSQDALYFRHKKKQKQQKNLFDKILSTSTHECHDLHVKQHIHSR